ncbi:IPT/TIG domain-containing protein [Flagellimonas sp. S3867]|uniref:IPT/TIG domain-containing protein n=1 Tax=Flagellimonas sp. S3867 TaxID=2768063 RepID=UPI0016875C71|nr:IPT/TIG domain-containing protein [Flagellimonas sp. S3867]
MKKLQYPLLILFGIILITCGKDDGPESPKPATIASFSPTEGEVGAQVTITGTNFGATASDNVIKFNGTTAAVSSATATTLVTTVPQGATTGKISVAVGTQTAVSSSGNFTVAEPQPESPTIASFSPTEGEVGAQVTITGTNFSATAADNTVKFNGTSATVSTASTTSLKVAVPEGATTGKISVAVGGKTATSGTDFTVIVPEPEPTIASFSPAEGEVGTQVTITGTNFNTTLSENTVQFNGTDATVSTATATSLTVTVPEGATTGKISVTVGENTATSTDDFTVLEPMVSITSFSPTEGEVGTEVTITGENFSATASENMVHFNGVAATVSNATATSLTVTVPEGATTGAIRITVNGQQATSGQNFTVTLSPWRQLENIDVSQMEGSINGVAHTIDDIIYFGLGFRNASSILFTDEFWAYNVVSGNLQKKKSYPGTPLTADAISFAIDGIIYVAGGHNTNENGSYFGSCYKYDPVTNNWTALANLPRVVSSSFSFSINGMGYSLGGRNLNGSLDELMQFDPQTEQWSIIGNYPEFRKRVGLSLVIDGKAYLFMGHDPSGDDYPAEMFIFDPADNSLTHKPNIGPTIGKSRPTGFVIGDKAYLGLGGEGYSVPNAGALDWWEYTPATDTWVQKTNFLGTKRYGAFGATVNGKGYVGFGTVAGPSKKDIWEYTPENDQ